MAVCVALGPELRGMEKPSAEGIVVLGRKDLAARFRVDAEIKCERIGKGRQVPFPFLGQEEVLQVNSWASIQHGSSCEHTE